jgi:hypothetical protein
LKFVVSDLPVRFKLVRKRCTEKMGLELGEKIEAEISQSPGRLVTITMSTVTTCGKFSLGFGG